MSEGAYVKNTADREQVREANSKVDRRRKRELDDVREVMSTPAGRRLLWRQLTAAKMFESRFSENSLRMAFNEGNANQGAWLLADIDAACPELFDLMRREARDDEEQT